MDLIPSFSVDHTKIVPGIFTSRVDTLGDYNVTTYDVRVTKPNIEPNVDVAAMHSLEHLIATYLRNDPDWKDEVTANLQKSTICFCALISPLKMQKMFPELPQ